MPIRGFSGVGAAAECAPYRPSLACVTFRAALEQRTEQHPSARFQSANLHQGISNAAPRRHLHASNKPVRIRVERPTVHDPVWAVERAGTGCPGARSRDAFQSIVAVRIISAVGAVVGPGRAASAKDDENRNKNDCTHALPRLAWSSSGHGAHLDLTPEAHLPVKRSQPVLRASARRTAVEKLERF